MTWHDITINNIIDYVSRSSSVTRLQQVLHEWITGCSHLQGSYLGLLTYIIMIWWTNWEQTLFWNFVVVFGSKIEEATAAEQCCTRWIRPKRQTINKPEHSENNDVASVDFVIKNVSRKLGCPWMHQHWEFSTVSGTLLPHEDDCTHNYLSSPCRLRWTETKVCWDNGMKF